MVICTLWGDVMVLVHSVAVKMDPKEYSTFGALLRLLIVLGIPAAALQTIFARQAAAVTNDIQQRQLIATARAILLGTFLVWWFSQSASWPPPGRCRICSKSAIPSHSTSH